MGRIPALVSFCRETHETRVASGFPGPGAEWILPLASFDKTKTAVKKIGVDVREQFGGAGSMNVATK
jgi:hypothetical protein